MLATSSNARLNLHLQTKIFFTGFIDKYKTCEQTKLYLLKLSNRIPSPSSCISRKACLIICEISLFVTAAKKLGSHFAYLHVQYLREFAVARQEELEVNQ